MSRRPNELDPGLDDLAAAVLLLAEDRPEIAISRGAACRIGGEIVARHRDGEIRPQAEFVSRRIGGQVHFAADVLAGEVEKRFCRLQDGGLAAHISGALVGGDERVRAAIDGEWW